jgi:hypothetical protein
MAANYYPHRRLITALTNAIRPTVTFSVAHGYVVGQILSFRVPSDFGMFQINQLQGQVLTVPDTTSVTVDIDTSSWDAFSVPVSTSQADAACLPIASGFIEVSDITRPNLDCTFDKRPS